MKVCSACRRCYDDSVLSCTERNHDSLIEARPGSREIITNYSLDFLLECDVISETYTATNILLNQPCAVKTVGANLIGIVQQLRERFQNEAQTAAAVDHPNVVRVYESGMLDSNEFYVVTESVEGETLREYLNSVGSPSEKNAVKIARQMAEGLEAAHAAGVKHRNLNPTNIVLTSSPENGLQVKIQNFDFGNVRQVAASAIPDSEPHLNWLRYSSPEQCAAQTTDARTDIYSLGVVLYEMLEGQPPFNAPDAAELIRKQINEQPQPVKVSNFDVRALLTHTLMLALQKSPTSRLQTANAFARQLRHIEQLMTRSQIPVQAFERISVLNTTSSNVRMTQNNAFAAKSSNSFSEEIQLSVQETAKTVTLNSVEAEQPDLLKETVQEDNLVENVSVSPPELVFVKQKKVGDFQLASELDSTENKLAEGVPSEWEIIQVEREEFDCAAVVSEPFRLMDDSAVDPFEPESVISPAASIEETPAQPAKANLLFSYTAGRELRQSMMLSRPILAGASLAALLISAIIGVLINEKFQHSASQPLTATVPVLESASLPKPEEQTLTVSRNTVITEESDTEESDVSDLEKYTPMKLENSVSAAPLQGNKSQPHVEKVADKTKAKQKVKFENFVPEDTFRGDKSQSPIEKAANKTKTKQNTSLNKKLAPKKQISAPTEPDVHTRPRIVEEGTARRKN